MQEVLYSPSRVMIHQAFSAIAPIPKSFLHFLRSTTSCLLISEYCLTFSLVAIHLHHLPMRMQKVMRISSLSEENSVLKSFIWINANITKVLASP